MREQEQKGLPDSQRQIRFDGIDGLRAVAILGVVAFHTRPSLLEGGFIGVTMFFVITGFLATRSVIRAVDSHGTFQYERYLGRRIKRLWPATLATIALTAPFAWLFAPSLLDKVRTDALPGALFASNWVNIFRKLPYFAAAGLPSPLTHLWFLALVMQFYLVWPLLLMAIGRLVRAKWARTVVMVIIVLASSAAMWLLFDPDDTSRVYYGTDTRLAELAMGAMLAMLMQRADRTADDRKQADDGRGASAIILDVFGWLSLLALCAGFWFMNGYDDTMYHGGYLVAAILGALALAGAIRGVSLPRVLGCAPLRYLGSRSYSLYLMHYPLLQFMNPATRTEALPWWGWLIEAAVIWTATEAFYQLVEATRMYEPTPRSRHARASVEPSGRLRPGSWVMAALGIVTVAALTWAPVNWEQIAHDRMIQLRPELAEPAKPLALPKPKSIEKPSDDGTASNNATANQTNDDGSERNGDSAKPTSPSVAPIAEKVPDNLDASKYHYDPNTGSCNADIMMIGDSVTSGTKDAIQAAFPNGYINGKPNRQMPQAVSVFQQATTAGHSGSVIIYGLGTNGIIRNEQVVQQLIDLVGGKPVYFVTIRMPYPNQEKNNNSMMRAAASHNGNVGIIDWYKYSEGHGEYLYDDGIHPNMTGAYAYATMLRQAVCGQ